MTEVVDRKAAQMVRKAQALMNDEGRHWTKGSYQSSENGETLYCSVGAIRAVYGAAGISYPYSSIVPLRILAREIRKDFPDLAQRYPAGITTYGDHDLIVTWNDSHDRTWEEVSAMFERVAEILEG